MGLGALSDMTSVCSDFLSSGFILLSDLTYLYVCICVYMYACIYIYIHILYIHMCVSF